MRLTVHVEDAKRIKEEITTKEGVKTIMKTMTTLSFSDIRPEEVSTILNDIKNSGHGNPVKHYLSGERIPGHARGKRQS